MSNHLISYNYKEFKISLYVKRKLSYKKLFKICKEAVRFIYKINYIGYKIRQMNRGLKYIDKL